MNNHTKWSRRKFCKTVFSGQLLLDSVVSVDWIKDYTGHPQGNTVETDHSNFGGFGINYYWSSTEFSNQYAWGRNFFNDQQGNYIKYLTLFGVRAVRAF